MEHRLHLPRWVKDRLTRQKQDEGKQTRAAEFMQRIERAHRDTVPIRTSAKPSSYTRKVFDRETARRRGKRARLARRGKSVHSFRIYR